MRTYKITGDVQNRIIASNVADQLGLGVSVCPALNDYRNKNRVYHNIWHINEMLEFVNRKRDMYTEHEYRELLAAVIYHDVVYDPMAKDNEERSAEEFLKAVERIQDEDNRKYWQEHSGKVCELIMETKKHEYSNDKPEANREIILADLDRFNEPNFERFWAYTLALFKEYAAVDFHEFKQGRLGFLESYANRIREFMPQQAYDNIMKLIPALQAWHPTIAVYPGSFDPFHKGHLNILEKAEAIFDKVIVAVGSNPDKDQSQREELPEYVRSMYQVDTYDTYLSDYVNSKKYPLTVIRGLRNATDLQHEINQLRWIQEMDEDFKMVSIFCDKQYEHISSSGIRQFEKFGKRSPYRV